MLDAGGLCWSVFRGYIPLCHAVKRGMHGRRPGRFRNHGIGSPAASREPGGGLPSPAPQKSKFIFPAGNQRLGGAFIRRFRGGTEQSFARRPQAGKPR